MILRTMPEKVVLDLDGRPRPLVPEQQPAEVKVGADGFTQ